MANDFEDAVAHLNEVFAEHCAVEITYTRGAHSATISATKGSIRLQLAEPSGAVRIVRTENDFIFPAADLVLNGQQTEPARDDEITEVINGTTRTYTVLPPGRGEPCFRPSDNTYQRVRVHTKRAAD